MNPPSPKLVANTDFAVANWHDKPCTGKPLQSPGLLHKQKNGHFGELPAKDL